MDKKICITNIQKNLALQWMGQVGNRIVRWTWATEIWFYVDSGEPIANWEVADDEDSFQHFLDELYSY